MIDIIKDAYFAPLHTPDVKLHVITEGGHHWEFSPYPDGVVDIDTDDMFLSTNGRHICSLAGRLFAHSPIGRFITGLMNVNPFDNVNIDVGDLIGMEIVPIPVPIPDS
jgi:hypothetical protein